MKEKTNEENDAIVKASEELTWMLSGVEVQSTIESLGTVINMALFDTCSDLTRDDLGCIYRVKCILECLQITSKANTAASLSLN